MITKKQAQTLLKAACSFQANTATARESARNKYRQEESNEENILRIRVDGLIAHLAAELSNKIKEVDEKISYQISLSSSFIRTHFLITDCILNSDLIEALVLTRKQLESLARLHEIEHTSLDKLLKRVPNISNVLKGASGKIYGDLSEVSHFSTPRVADLLHIVSDGEMNGPSIYPHYTTYSHACFDANYFITIYFLVWLLEKLKVWYPASNFDEQVKILNETMLIAIDCGVLKLKSDT